MKITICALCGLSLLAGCATTNPAAMAKAELVSEYTCTPGPFVEATDCVRLAFDSSYPRWRADANADLVNIFLAWTRAEAIRVSGGEVDEPTAKTRAATLHARLNQVAYARQVQRQINSERAAAIMLTGLAVMSVAAQAQAAARQSTPIVCNTMGNAQFSTTVCQ